MWFLLLIMSAVLEPAAMAVPPAVYAPSGAIVTDYRPEKCQYCGAETWCEVRSNGKRQCRACKVERFFSQVLYPPLGYTLIGWQRKVLRDIYGTVLPATGIRRYRSAFIEVAKKNGKSFLIGGMPIYNLLMEDEQNPEAYGAAASKDQAGLVFKSAAMLVNANPDLLAELKVLPSTKRIVRRDGRGFYAVVSADGDMQDGIEPSLCMRDELHRWKTARAETLKDVMTKGQISRREPLDVVITTAGAEYESPLWLEEYEQAKRVQDGSLRIDSLYVAIFEPDLKRLNSDDEYWKSREARVAANPSHEDMGGFLQDAAIAAELQKALNNPRARSKYFRYHLNVPTKALEDPVIDMQKWQRCGGGVDLREWPEFDEVRLMKEWGIGKQPCWAGVDASWTTDLTAVVAIVPPFASVNEWTFMPFFFMPQERVDDLERICRVPFSNWIEKKFITATPGNSIDMRAVMERIVWMKEQFELREVPFDRTNFRTEASTLKDKEEIETVEVNQNFMTLGYSTKFLLSAYGDFKIRHGNHPVLNWMASCMQLKYDDKDNCQPSKPHRGRSSKRIDGMQAIVTGLNRALLAVPQNTGTIEVW